MAKSPRRRKADAPAPAAAPKDTRQLDHLPDDLRQAIQDCPFRIDAPLKLRRGFNSAVLADQIKAVKSEEDAAEINRIIATQVNR